MSAPPVLHALTDEKVMSTKEAWIITTGHEKALVILAGPGRHYCLDSHVHYDSVDETFDEARMWSARIQYGANISPTSLPPTPEYKYTLSYRIGCTYVIDRRILR